MNLDLIHVDGAIAAMASPKEGAEKPEEIRDKRLNDNVRSDFDGVYRFSPKQLDLCWYLRYERDVFASELLSVAEGQQT